ncbi:lantibiotic dehydratase [Streptomyces sp. NBC_01716]|uniref:lantibiotic dehydratase n=1 Tax=Streptomyces sp. NBC_01716 TaxID=2975917 RepID=UPI002E2FD7D3|nr:lantibiotic dehydratase [Streptomyces sp. NBC_01716]
MYQAVDAAMIRASVFPLTATLPSCPAPVSDRTADAESCLRWIGQVWSDEARAGAIELAAPVLAASIRKALIGEGRRSRMRRIALSLTRYLLRMQFRATPFGTFAGPAPVHLGPSSSVYFGTRHTAFARADASWLHDIITALEQDPDVLRHLRVVADRTCTVRSARITVAHQPGATGPTETTLRRTRASELALSLAQSPTTVSDLTVKLQGDYPDTPVQTIEDMVRTLVAHRVLLTNLHAPMTCDDALGHLVGQLDRTLRTGAPGSAVQAKAEKLRHVQQLLHQHDRALPDEQRALRAQATAAMNRLTQTADRSLAVNLRPDCSIVLPQEVADEASQALEVIARITPYPNGSPAWRDYLTRFLERYSMGTVVPVRELTDPDTGLGFPVGYRNTVFPRPVLATTPRDEHLLALTQEAALTGRREIVLTEDEINALSTGTPTQVPAHIDFTFTVLAQSQRALDEGHFTLSTVGLSLAAGITTGRFLPTLEPADLDQVTTVHTALPTLTESAIRAQVSGPPLKIPITNVSRSPLVAPELLSVGEHNPDATLDLDDLGVLADAARFYLVSLSTGRIIEPKVMNAVELSSSTHPLIRFVCELHRSHTAVLLPFFWGAASRLPFLPEVRVGRTVLSPALWRMRDLGDGDDWPERFSTWRSKYTVPRTVYLGATDQRLRLDLDVPVHQELLRAELRRHSAAVLHEAPEESAYGWINRAHEVAMTFASDQKPALAPAVRASARRDSGRLPGASPWMYVKLYGSAARVPEVLTALPRLLRQDWGTLPAWFIRYADPDAHLRLRLRLPGPGAFGSLAQAVARWASELRHEGLIQRVQWDTDHPETGRYGTGDALEAAEEYFVADSTAALRQLSLTMTPELRPAVTAASFVDIATGFLGSRKAACTWLTQHLPRGDGAPVPRNVQALALRLSEPEIHNALTGFPGGDAVAEAWHARKRTLNSYRRVLTDDADAVLLSLLHMHHNRVAGIDRTAEATCRRIARAAALSRTLIPEGDA